ncbi:MAG TPA: methylmalonyl-CoA carboxyltransferase, partial [Actinomycetota bacterium]
MAEDWVEELLDPGSFVATATGGRSGHGSVDGCPVCVFDGPGPAAVAALDLALKVGCPVVGSAGGGDPGDAGADGDLL